MRGTAAEWVAIVVTGALFWLTIAVFARLTGRLWPHHAFRNYPMRPWIIGIRLMTAAAPWFVVLGGAMALSLKGQGSLQEHLVWWLRLTAIPAAISLMRIAIRDWSRSRPPKPDPLQGTKWQHQPSTDARSRGLFALTVLLSFLAGWLVAGERPAPSLDAGAIAVGNSFLTALEEQDWEKVEAFIAEPRLIQDLQTMRNLRRTGQPEISSEQFFTLRGPHLEYPIKATWGECGYAERLALYMKMDWRGRWEIEWTAFTHFGTC